MGKIKIYCRSIKGNFELSNRSGQSCTVRFHVFRKLLIPLRKYTKGGSMAFLPPKKGTKPLTHE